LAFVEQLEQSAPFKTISNNTSAGLFRTVQQTNLSKNRNGNQITPLVAIHKTKKHLKQISLTKAIHRLFFVLSIY
jgi:hypothetical protein